ncbi:MAG: zinc ribbon domain-containing protein [Eubacteriales bacterium]
MVISRTLIVLFILGIVFLLLLIGIIVYVKKKVERASSMLFGTKSVAKGLQNVQKEYETTPKTVAGAANLYLPTIMRDFPDFHYDEMRERAERVLTSYLLSIHNRSNQLPEYVNSDLKHQLELYLQVLSNNNHKEYFHSVKIHDCQLSRYSKEKGTCRVIFQAAIASKHYVEDSMHQVITGSKTAMEQTKYNIHMIYIQDRSIAEEALEDGLGLNCPNCGAAITNLGQKFCEYCGSGVVALNINTWSFSDVEQV